MSPHSQRRDIQLVNLIGRVIRRLRAKPHTLRASNWDHPDGLNVSAINSAAAHLGIGPIFAIGEASDWVSWPNLPADHPQNQLKVDCLTVFHPDGSRHEIRKLNGQLEDYTDLPITETIARLEAWIELASETTSNRIDSDSNTVEPASAADHQKPNIPENDQGKAKTIGEVVALVNSKWDRKVSERTIRIWFEDGTVKRYMQGKLYIFSLSDLDAATR